MVGIGSRVQLPPGRDAYASRLLQASEQHSGGLLLGPAGIGKTYLLQHWGRHLTRSDHSVVAVLASEATHSIFLGAFAAMLGDGPSPDQAHAISQVVTNLRARAAGSPLALFVDDVHWLDKGSIAVIQQLTTDQQFMDTSSDDSIWMTAREVEGLDSSLIDMWRSGTISRVDVHALTEAETGSVVAHLLDGLVSTELEQQLATITQGVPLYLRELLADCDASGTLELVDGSWLSNTEITPGGRLTDLLKLRLDKLGSEDRDLVDLVSIVAPVPRSILGGDEARLRSLERRGFLTRSEDQSGITTGPGHPLIAEAATELMLPERRMVLLRQLVGSLPDAPSDRGLAMRLGALAVESELDLPPVWLLKGAREAIASAAPELASDLSQAGLILEDSSQMHELRGDVLNAAGRYKEADHHLAIAQTAAQTDDDIVRISHTRSMVLGFALADPDAAIAALQFALEAVSDEAREQVEVHTSGLAVLLGSFPSVIEVSESLLKRPMPGSLRAQALGNLVFAESSLLLFDKFDEHMEEVLELIEQNRSSNPAEFDLMWAIKAGAHTARGEFGSHSEDIMSFLKLRSDGGSVAATASYAQAKSLLIQGNASAIDLLNSANSALVAHDPFGARPQVLGSLAFGHCLNGNPAMARTILEGIDPLTIQKDPRALVIVGRGEAALAAMSGDFADAAQVALLAAQPVIETNNPDLAIGALHDMMRYGEADQGAALMADLDLGDGAVFFELLRTQTQAASAGDLAQLQACAASYLELGANVVAGEAWIIVRRIATAQHGPDHPRVIQASAAAQLINLRCSLKHWPGYRSDLEPLSAREAEIAAAAIEGLTSREIAENMFVSSRTVDNHLGAIYRRLGIQSRTQLRSLLSGTASEP